MLSFILLLCSFCLNLHITRPLEICLRYIVFSILQIVRLNVLWKHLETNLSTSIITSGYISLTHLASFLNLCRNSGFQLNLSIRSFFAAIRLRTHWFRVKCVCLLLEIYFICIFLCLRFFRRRGKSHLIFRYNAIRTYFHMNSLSLLIMHNLSLNKRVHLVYWSPLVHSNHGI